MNTNQLKSTKRYFQMNNENNDYVKRQKINDESMANDYQQEENNAGMETEDEPEEETLNFRGSFDMKKFRNKLQTGDFIFELRHFLQIASTDSEIISKYFKSGGKPLELVEAIDRLQDKNDPNQLCYLFHVLQLTLIEVLTNSNQYNQASIQACSFLLNSHRSSLTKLLDSHLNHHKKIILKLFTAVVALEAQFGRDILNTFSMVFNAETLDRFTKHSKVAVKNDRESVRICYIHFILAFLIEGNSILIRNLLDRNEFIMSIVSGLIYDSAETVCLVLSTLQKYVLKSTQVTKTKKIQVFYTDVVKELLTLYNWKGPKYFLAMYDKKVTNLEMHISPTELETVSSSVHEFLIILLTSRKYGTAFQSLGYRRIKANNIQKRILTYYLDKPWENAKKSALSIEILKACPELAHGFFKATAFALDPQKPYWSKAAEYFCNVISALTPSIIRVGIEQMNIRETIQVVKALCMSPDMLQYLRRVSTIKNTDLQIRKKSTKLLYLMLKQCNQYLIEISSWNIFTPNDLKKIKFDFINHIFIMFPSVQNILLSLHSTLREPDDPDMFDHLENVLDLLLIIAKTVPSFIETTSSVINYINILRPIYDLNREHSSSTGIELKAIKLIMALEPKALTPHTDFFNQVVQSFINVLVYGSFPEQQEAKGLLRNVLYNTGLFDNGVLEIDLWLEAFKQVDSDSLNDVQEFFVKAIRNGKMDDAKSIAFSSSSDQQTIVHRNISELFHKIENGIALSGSIDMLTMSYFLQFSISQFDDETPESVVDYIDNVALNLFHYLPMNKAVYSSIKSKCKHSKYMKNWIKNQNPKQLVDHKSKHLCKLYNAIMTNESNIFEQIFITTDSDVQFKINGVEKKVDQILTNETEVMNYIYTTIFISINLMEQEILQQTIRQEIVNILKCFLDILQQLSTVESKQMSPGFEIDQCQSPFYRAIDYIFCRRFYFFDRFDLWNANESTSILYDLLLYIRTLIGVQYLDPVLNHYQSKITNQIEASYQQQLSTMKSSNAMNIIETFSLKPENCLMIVESLSNLKYDRFVVDGNNRSIYVDILSWCLKKLTEFRSHSLQPATIQQISLIYIKIINSNEAEINLEIFEDALQQYLTIFYQSIGDIPHHLFTAIFECKKLTKANIKLATLLLDRNKQLQQIFFKILPDHLAKKELIYPLLNVACTKVIDFDLTILQKVYEEFKNGIAKTIEKPQKAGVIYRENIYSSLWLIEHCMPLNECIGFCQKNFKFDAAELYQIQIIKGIHLKALTTATFEQQQQAFLSFLNVSIQLMTTLFKRDSIDFDKINAFATIAAKWLHFKNKLKSLQSISFDTIVSSQAWSLFSKNCLKSGLQYELNETSPNATEKSAILLKIFAYFADQFYPNGNSNADAARYFEMTISHSKFFDVALQQKPNEIKTYAMYVLYVLLKKDSSSMQINHIPVFLGAYQAKLNHCDRFILAILQMYEENGINMNDFKPFIWGESAISYYSLHGSDEKSNIIQEPPMMQALSLIDRDAAEHTLANFPVWRRLNAIQQVPEIEFEYIGIPGNEHLEEPYIASNRLEKCVVRNEFDPNLLLLGSRSDSSFDDVYDPAFYIPLMSMAFGPKTFTRPVRPVQNGLLAITFAALSSQDKELRLATGNALLRYQSQMEMARFLDHKIWTHLFDCIRRGLSDLTSEMRKHKKSRIPRVPYIAGNFLGRCVNILVNPLSEMYRPLTSYILFKESFEFLTVPEFNVLFNSSDVNHIKYRTFILEVIRDGVKCGSDFTILMSFNIFKALLGFYDSSMSSRDTNLLILTIINASVKIPKSTKILICNVGLTPWLSSIIDNVEFFQFDIIDGLCNIINNIWHSIQFNSTDYTNIPEIEQRLFHLLLKLCPKLSTRTDLKAYAKFLNIFARILKHQPTCGTLIDESNLNHLITCAKAHTKEICVEDLSLTMYARVDYCESKWSYVKKLRQIGWNEMNIFIESTLRDIILNWLRNKQLNC